jgi:hypothetical protein
MTSITIDIDLDDFDDDEIVDELVARGYHVSKNKDIDSFTDEDFMLMLNLIDGVTETIEIRRLRDKLILARFG